MESLSFLFIGIGAMLALVRRVKLGGGRVTLVELLVALTIVIVALASWADVFVGPIGDARRYHQTINLCFASVPPCGSKLHEQLWSLVSSVIGIGWGLIYGFLVTYGMYFLARGAGISSRSPILVLFFLYCAYQIGNGMAEGTIFLLLLMGVIAVQAHRVSAAMLSFVGTFVAHIGYAPLVLYILRLPRWRLLAIIAGGLSITFVGISLNFRYEDLTAIVGKAGALISQDVAMLAIENKVRVSIRDAETSYAALLSENGFPSSTRGFIMAIWFYIFPIVTGGDGINLAISGLGTAFSLMSFWLSRRSVLLFVIVVLSTLIFAPASFTPGIGLRHKVPVFLLLLMAKPSTRSRGLSWHK